MADASDEISTLIETLRLTEQRLEELTAGEVDTVSGSDGRTFFLRRAQEQFRNSEAAKQTAILNALPANIALLDHQGVILSVNARWQNFAGSNPLIDSSFGVGQNYVEICGAQGAGSEEAHATAAGIGSILSGASTTEFLLEYSSHSPTEKRWFLLRVNPIKREGLSGAVVMHTDITERKRSELSVSESGQRLALATESAHIGIWDWNVAADQLIWDKQMYELYGIREQDFSGAYDAWQRGLHPEDRVRSEAEIAAAIKGSRDFHSEFRVLWPNGEVRYIEAHGLVRRAGDGSAVRMIGVNWDITEQKRTEARFRRLVDSNAQGVIFFDVRGKIIEANDAFLSIVGYTREDLKNGELDWVALTPPEYAGLDRRALEQIAAKGVCPPYEKEYTRKDGSRVPILIGAASFEDDPGEGVAFVVDLTERKKIEQQFLRSQRMESIGTLAGGIAHDLNNVLAPILMSVEILKSTVSDEQSIKMLETLQNSAQRGADLVKQVLSFARGIEGQRVLVNPVTIIRELLQVMKDTFPKNIQTSFKPAANLWALTGDPTQFHQVFLNLCVNARDAMPGGGSLSISIENVEVDKTYAAMNPGANAGSYVMVRVDDTGSGIPAEIRDRIFEPFFTTKELGNGTGLGLSTTATIVKSHGGFINLQSEIDKGTKFKVYLPATASKAAEDAVAAHPQLSRGNGEMILVVDDEDAIRQVTSETLEHFGYRTLLAKHGAEGVALYAQHRQEIALVLTDMVMPIMDGPMLIVALKAINPQIIVIGSSGRGSKDGVAKALAAGVRHFIPKPYTADAMLDILHKALHGVLDIKVP